jgi:hypothetical protein
MTSQRSHTITGVAAATGEMLGVVRVPTRLMANSRRASRERGKSDLIDALPVARAALAEGIETLPTAELAGPELDIRLCWSTIASGTVLPPPSGHRQDPLAPPVRRCTTRRHRQLRRRAPRVCVVLGRAGLGPRPTLSDYGCWSTGPG